MSTTNEMVNLVAEMAMEVNESGTLIDFAGLSIDEDATFHTMASHVVEGYCDQFNGNVVAMATVTALVVENFILQLKLKRAGLQ